MRALLSLPFRLRPALALGLLLAWALTARAQTLFWDVNGNTTGAVTAPSTTPNGTWAAGSGNWNTSSTGTGGTVSNWTNGYDAVFSAGTNGSGAYNVTVSGTVDAASITIQEGTPTFNGGTIRLEKTSPDFTVGTGLTATVNSVLDDWYYSGLNKAGDGTLVLSGNNLYQAATTVSAGTLILTNSNALGASVYGNTVSSGATLALQGGITVDQGGFNVGGAGYSNTGAIRNISGTNTLKGQVNLQSNTTIAVNAGALTLTGQVGTATYNLTTAGAGNVTFGGNLNGDGGLIQTGSGAVAVNADSNLTGNITQSGTGSLAFTGTVNNAGTITQSGSGTLTFSGTSGNSISGVLNINAGTVALAKTAGLNAISSSAVNIASGATLRLDANNQIADYTGAINVAAGGTFNVNGKTETINSLFSSGTVALGAGTLTVGTGSGNVSLGNATAANAVTGTGTLIKNGTGTLALLSSIVLAGQLQLNAGTLALSGFNLTANSLRVTGNSTIDFAGGNSTLSLTNFIIDAGVTLTITNWTGAADYFYTQGWTGATFNTSGTTPMNQVVFDGVAGGSRWQSFDKQITPVPEPSTYGALLLLGTGGFAAWRRFRTRRRA